MEKKIINVRVSVFDAAFYKKVFVMHKSSYIWLQIQAVLYTATRKIDLF